MDLETPGHINYHTPKSDDPDITLVAEKTLETSDEDLDITLVAEMTLESNDDGVDPLAQSVIRGDSSHPEDVNLLVTDQWNPRDHPYFCLPPFTITNKHPSKVTSDTAAKAEAQAMEYDIIDDVTNAVPAYLDAIEQRAQVSGGESASVCGLLSRLASIYITTGRLEESISAYRRAIAPYRGLLESALPDMCQLAEALIEQGEYEEAEDIFRRAIQILVKAGDQERITSYNLKLVELLQKLNRHEDAIDILHPLLNTQMEINSDDFASILCTLGSLKSSYEKLYPGGQCSGAIARMSSVAEGTRFDSDELFQGFLSIADSFSSEGEFRIATSMYKAVSTVYEDSNPGYRKALYLYYYAKHLSRIQDYAAVLLYLQASVAILVELGRREGKLAHRVRSFLNSIRGVLERVPTSRDMLDNILKIQALLSGSRSTITSSDSRNVIRLADELESEGKSEMRTTTTSNKYGVTFSVSDITGISLSEFSVP
jgi:tetratricopeptide (TPR) repeat protein